MNDVQPVSKFQVGDAVIVYLPEPFRRAQPTGIVQAVAPYTAEGETVYEIQMDDGDRPPAITVRERYIECYGVLTVAAQEAAHHD